MPEIKAIVVLDGEGARIAAKYGSKEDFADKQAQTEFEKKLFKKTRNNQSRSDAEVALLDGFTCVFRTNADLSFYVVGAAEENELILVSVLDAVHDSINNLLKGMVDKRNVLANLELLLLAIDEIVDGTVILELDAGLVESRVMLRGAVAEVVSSYKERTMGQVMEQLKGSAAKQMNK